MKFSFANAADTLRLPLTSDGHAGLRHAQVAAGHAIAAHFWASSRPAIVVMPTGSGKTAVMILAPMLLRSSRVLVVAPSRLLREQLAENFAELSPLRSVGALSSDANCPIVEEQDGRIDSAAAWENLRRAQVVVALPHSTSPGVKGIVRPPPDLFDLVLVDEAHHLPATIYRELADAFPAAKKVLFTATPFRRDEREIPGDLVFTYHLAQARRDGIFGQLRFVPLDAAATASQRERDEAIARAAAGQLAADRATGFDHRLLVRASSLERADELAAVYAAVTTLKVRRIHSALSQKWVKDAVESLRSGALDGIIAVDMLGEGFDLPNLKVAALHARHRSLAVTLQFIGRFARTSTEKKLGPASFFAIPDEIERDAEGLYVPGAEWNELVDTLSRERIEGEAQARDFVRTFARQAHAESETEDADRPIEYDDLSDDDAWGMLRTLRPYFHVKAYDALATPNLDAQLGVPAGLNALLTRRSAKHNAVVWIGREEHIAGFATHEAWIDVKHEMFLLVHVPEERLLFVCSSRRDNSVYDALVSSVLGDRYRRLTTNEVNRVLRGIASPEFFSLGMRNRAGSGGGGAESYKMLAGRSTDRAVRVSDGKLYNQGHGFCRGEEDGKSVTIGFSSSSKVWANRRDGLDEFVAWMRAIARKLRQDGAVKTGSGFDNLGTARRVTLLEHKIVSADLPHDAYARNEARVRVESAACWLVDLAVQIRVQSATSVDFALVGGEVDLSFRLTLGRSPLIAAIGQRSEAAVVCDEAGQRPESLDAYLNENPPVFYLENLARLDGDEQQDPPGRTDPEPIARQIVPFDWRALGVDPCVEKPPTKDAKFKSIFEHVESTLQASGNSVVFLDDGAGEVADYVSIALAEGRVWVRLFHCKAAKAGSRVPNQQIANLYEVVCQAIKCRRYLDARRLAAQLAHRVSLPGCEFRVGNMKLVRELLADQSRVVFEVVIVQPALSTQPSEPIARLLEAADAYMRGGDQRPMVFWGTTPSR